MLSERIRSRLSQLNREPLPPAQLKSAPAVESAKSAQPDSIVLPKEKNDLLCDGGREVETPYGKHWLIVRPIAELWDCSAAAIDTATRAWKTSESPAGQHADWRQFQQSFPQQCVFLDLETCGFAGSMVFLIGAIHDSGDEFVLSQMLARNYAEERAVLFTLWEIVRSRGVLLTFNGKSFDWPMINDRSVLHRLDAAGQTYAIEHHVDLLHHARRQYRRELPNCRLQTLEWYLCGRRRVGDIPGSEIPDAYHRYVRSGESLEMKSILHHNALDLITLLQLSLRMSAP